MANECIWSDVIVYLNGWDPYYRYGPFYFVIQIWRLMSWIIKRWHDFQWSSIQRMCRFELSQVYQRDPPGYCGQKLWSSEPVVLVEWKTSEIHWDWKCQVQLLHVWIDLVSWPRNHSRWAHLKNGTDDWIVYMFQAGVLGKFPVNTRW